MPENTIEQATANLKEFLPHLRYAIETARKQPNCKQIKLGLLQYFESEEGENPLLGKVDTSFGIEFVDDLATILGMNELTQEEFINAAATRFMQEFGLNKGETKND